MITSPGDPAATVRQAHFDSVAASLRTYSRDELIAEHAARPFGPHSDKLARVLNFVRAADVVGKHVILADAQATSLWHIATITGRRVEGSLEITGQSHSSIEAAEHAVFLLRLDALGIADPPQEED